MMENSFGITGIMGFLGQSHKSQNTTVPQTIFSNICI